MAEIGALGLGFSFVAAAMLVGARNLMTLVVEPQSTELRLIRSQVAALPPNSGRVAYTLVGWDQGVSPRFFSDELGIPSSARIWTAETGVYLILAEMGRLGPGMQRPEIDVVAPYTGVIPANEPVINLYSLERLR